MSFEYLDDDQRRPVLILSSLQGKNLPLLLTSDGSENDFTKSHARIRLLPSISPNLFPTNKLKPTQANIRTTSKPSPLYNASIQSDALHLHFLTNLYQSSQLCPSFLDTVLLGKVWLRQRGFTGSYHSGGFGSFEWTWFLSYLLREGGPNGHNALEVNFSSFQLFRGALNNLVIKDRIVEDTVECIDADSGMNVFYKMTPTSYKLVYLEQWI
jgi:U3 small nucleolar RNA-associated protein 22